MPAALFWGPFLDFDFSKYCFRAIAVPAALFGDPFLDFDFSKYRFRAITVPAALFGGPFLDFESPNVILFFYRYRFILIGTYFRLQIQILAFENYFCNRSV